MKNNKKNIWIAIVVLFIAAIVFFPEQVGYSLGVIIRFWYISIPVAAVIIIAARNHKNPKDESNKEQQV